MKAGRLDRIRPAAVGAGRWAVGTRRNTGPSRRARSGLAAVDTRRWAGQWAVGFGLALLLLLVWPTQVSAQTPPPPAPGAGGEIVEYYATDALGSIRVVFTAAGAEVARADYLPFGERFTATGPLPPQQFTGQQRDPEAQLDHFNARSYQTTTGRFTGMDPVYAGLFDPQQWNRYAYARGNPLKYIDPDGRQVVVPTFHVTTIELYAVHNVHTLPSPVVSSMGSFGTPSGSGTPPGVGEHTDTFGQYLGSLFNGGDLGDVFETGIGADFAGGITVTPVEAKASVLDIPASPLALPVAAAATVVQKTASVVVKGRSIRRPLISATGWDPGKLCEAHHCAPWKLAQELWKMARFNVNQYGAWVETSFHRSTAYKVGQEWDDYLNAGNVTTKGILNLIHEQAKTYGWEVVKLW